MVAAAQDAMSSRSDDSANPISPSSKEDVNEGFTVPSDYDGLVNFPKFDELLAYSSAMNVVEWPSNHKFQLFPSSPHTPLERKTDIR